MPEEEMWISMNGCNACINTNVCNELGNCAMLNIDIGFPEQNKAKRRLIQKIRTLPNKRIENYVKDVLNRKKFTEAQPEENVKEYKPTVRLTRLEQIFIENLNKKRYND